MSVNDQLTRIKNSRDTIRTKMVSLGLGASDDKLDELATAVNGIAVKTSSNMTVSGATVTAPAGYYKTAQSKSVSTATQATPSITVSSTGLITASATQSAGYVSSGTKSKTSQLSTQAATTITPGTSNKTAVAAGKYTTGAVTVKGDANLKAENIMKGVSIFGVAGAAEGGGTEVEEITNGAGGKSVYINSEAPKLPEGFTRLEYIQSSGTQYVDTGVLVNNSTRLIADAQFVTGKNGHLASATDGTRFWTLYIDSNVIGSRYGTGAAKLFSANAPVWSDRNVYDKNKETTTVGQYSVSSAAATFSISHTLSLFARNNSGTKDYFATARLYGCQIYDNDVLVRDFVPCLNANNVAGLYDMVNGVFYGDAAGGAFVAGPVVAGTSVSKVVLEDQVLIDLTQDTISPETVLAGIIGHDKTGAQFVGELVQKSGGRPFASGVFSPTSNVYTMTISGLSFKPTAMFLVPDLSINSGTQSVFGTFANWLYYYDTEKNKFLWFRTDSDYSNIYVQFTNGQYYNGSTSPGYVAMNRDGFTAGRYYNNGYYFQRGYSYYWYAIGAAL